VLKTEKVDQMLRKYEKICFEAILCTACYCQSKPCNIQLAAVENENDDIININQILGLLKVTIYIFSPIQDVEE
jgi:hypothetical protein